MLPLPIEPVQTGGGEADRLTSHRLLCDRARGRWASLGNAAEGLRTLLVGHIVSTALALTALASGLAWLMR